ncbi:tetratricopeptide repeat protein [Streptomyces sporangiiformans]|uniref:tetratricopeptide repeat protein n=1 Tax=Streptomyces sporangiiformans TaxID=2315329 RepID=UPI0013C52B2F|nr:tetratricopeptide repeat protein [Streptomyces sporangiiformans]
MGRARPSMQQLIRERRRQGFVGRVAERAAFRANFDLAPEDERHRFLFHVHGNAGVGKTFLVRQLEQIAQERGALTVYVDEAVGSVPEAMAALSTQFARQGHRFKELDRMLAAHRERRHAAESAAVAMLDPEPGPEAQSASPTPSAGSMTVARAGLVGLGLVPGVGAFAGAIDPAQLAQGADRLRALISARLGNAEDVQLVLAPERVLTPVLLKELTEVCAEVPWIVLFFDTYERTGPFLDGWLHDVMTTDRHGDLPANVVVVTAGRPPFDTARWGGLADFVTDVPLSPFTESEARGLLADKGVVAEPVVEEVLRLTGGLPVLVSTLAQARPTDPDGVGDPSATAVERFLKWEQDPVRRAAALACALPRRLDADVFRAAVECAEEEAEGLFTWLRALPFVSDRGDRLQYHDVVRAPMLRLQRLRSPRGWEERHRRLAEVFAQWRTEAEGARDTEDARDTEGGRDAEELWADERWRELRLAESYHLLCAGARTALPAMLRDFVDAVGNVGDAAAARWAQALVDAGRDADAQDAARWGSELSQALADGGSADALGLLLRRAGFDEPAQALAHAVRGSALRHGGAYEEALAEYDRAVALDPGLARAYRSRALARGGMGDNDAAVEDLDRALALAPDDARGYAMRGEYRRIQQRYEEAIEDLDRAIRLDPTRDFAWASRGATRLSRGELDAAVADLDRALELNPDYVWALARRARVWRALRQPARQMADLDRALTLQPDWAWGACERGDVLRVAGRYELALADYDRAIELNSEYASAYASRGVCRRAMGRHGAALEDLDRAVALNRAYPWALCQRAVVHLELGAPEKALADTDWARSLRSDDALILTWRGRALDALDRFDEARAELDRALELNPDFALARGFRGTLLLRMGLYEEASEDLNRCLALVESEPEPEPDSGPGYGSEPESQSTSTPTPASASTSWDGAGLDRAAAVLDTLLRAPGTAQGSLAPLLARITAARDTARPPATA